MASQHRETYYYRDSDGKEKSIRLSGRSKRDTDEKYRQLIMDLMPCVKPVKASVPTLRQFIDRVYRPRFMATLEPTTADSYEQFIKLNILPFMGDMPMNEVDVSIVQEFMQWMATAKHRGRKKNLNKATINRVCGLLNRMYKIAQAMKLVEDNPVKLQLLRNPGEEAGHHTAASDADVDMVKQRIPSLENEQQRLFAALLVYTGMRKEEVLGLKWSNIHLQERYGEVVQAVTYAGSKKETHIKQPKTAASERVFVIPTALADILKGCQQHDGYIIHGRSLDTPACYSTQKRLYEAAFEELGIKGKYSSHDWRSTFGTQLRESGMSSGNVASLLGHADTRMVETVYARTRRDSVLKQREAIETLNKNYLKNNTAIS